MLFVSVLVVSLTILAGRGEALKWSQCGSKNNVLIKNVDLAPDPLKIPGNAQLSVDAAILKPLNGSDVLITIRRRIIFSYIKIPCIYGIGSCTYENTCNLIKQMKDKTWGGYLGPVFTEMMGAFSAANIQCPISVQEIKLVKIPLTLPMMPSYLTYFAKGDYKIQFHAKDRKDGKTILCLDWEMTVG